MEKMRLDSKIVISAMGMISPYGMGVELFESALKNKQSAISNISTTHPEHSKILSVAGFLPENNLANKINDINCDESIRVKFKSLAARAPLSVQASLLSSLQAFQQAKLYALENTEKVGIIVTGTNTTLQQTYEQHTIYAQEPAYVSSRYGLNFLDSNHIGYVSEFLNISGEGHVVGAASASGNMAIIQAMRLLEQGILDQCFVIGVMAELSPVELQALRQLDVLGAKTFKENPTQASRPFDRAHEGFIPAQLSACLLLERVESAKSRQAPILGYLLGAGIALDKNHSSNPSETGEAPAMQKALSAAKINALQIDYINAHGTSSVLGDEVECKAIQAIFGNRDIKYINSTKSVIGHGLWSAGIAEAIAVIVQMNGNYLHASLNLEDPINENIGLIQDTVLQGNFNIALSNNFAFGGINTSVIFHKGELL